MNRKSQILELLKESPNDNFLMYALALEYEKEADLLQALEVLNQLQAQSPEYLGLYYKKAEILYQIKKTDEALKTIDEAINLAKRLQNHKTHKELLNLRSNIEFDF